MTKTAAMTTPSGEAKNLRMLASSSSIGKDDEAKPSSLPSTDTAATTVPSQDFVRAASLISIWGPCRRVGDEYLSCVVTAGMGMCKPLRRTFEQCAQETSDHAVGMLDQLALQACSHIDNSNPNNNNNNKKDMIIAKRNCAAEFLLRSQPQGPMQ